MNIPAIRGRVTAWRRAGRDFESGKKIFNLVIGPLRAFQGFVR
jgi:hypothetical protein